MKIIGNNCSCSTNYFIFPQCCRSSDAWSYRLYPLVSSAECPSY